MTQFKCKLSSNIRQDFPNHFMSLWSETRKRRQSKFSASTSLTETSLHHAISTEKCQIWIATLSYLHKGLGKWRFSSKVIIRNWKSTFIANKYILLLIFIEICIFRHRKRMYNDKLKTYTKIAVFPKCIYNMKIIRWYIQYFIFSKSYVVRTR